MSSTPTKHSPAQAQAAARKLHSLLRDPHSPAKKEGAPARDPESSAMASASSPVGLPVEELMSCLKAMQAHATTNTEVGTTAMEVGTTAIALGTKALEGLDNLASVVQDNRNDHDNLRRAHDALAANVNVEVGDLRGRVNKLEMMSPTAAASSGTAFSFDSAVPGDDQKQPALPSTDAIGSSRGAAASGSFGAGATSVASAAGGGFGSGTTAATAAGFAAPGTLSLGAAAAASGPFAGTTAVLGSDNAASLKSSSSGGSVPTFGAGAGSAGAGAGTNGAGFSFDGPTSGSFGTLKNSAPSAAPSVSFGIGTQDPSLKDAVGFQQVSISTFFLSC